MKAREAPAGAAVPAADGGRTGIVSRQPIHEQILPHIRADIVGNRWKPGERLPEPQLCREFGISRTPLRDAFKILEAEGLVKLLPHVGAVVTDPGQPDVAEKMEILSALEQLAAAKVAQSRPPATLAEIRRLHRAMQDAAEARDAAGYYRLNDHFHRAIVLGAGNKTLSDMHEMIMWHVYRARHRANAHEPLSKAGSEHHGRIVRHLCDGKPEEAARAMRDHLNEVSRIIVDHTAGRESESSSEDRAHSPGGEPTA